jgi:hypothetical protein
MTVRIVSRLILLLVALAAATVLLVGGLSRLASATPADAVSLTQRDQAVAVERAVEAPAEQADSSRSPLVVLLQLPTRLVLRRLSRVPSRRPGGAAGRGRGARTSGPTSGCSRGTRATAGPG